MNDLLTANCLSIVALEGESGPKHVDVAIGTGESQKMGVEFMCDIHIDNQIL